MKSFKIAIAATGLMLGIALATPVTAQESSYKHGPIWEVSGIDIMPGQAENYMDYLSTTWKKVQELGKAEGIVVDYQVLTINNRRKGEPDMYLVVVYRDYQTIAQQEAFEKKVNAMMTQDRRKATVASAERGKMREQLGSVQYQEIVLK